MVVYSLNSDDVSGVCALSPHASHDSDEDLRISKI